MERESELKKPNAAFDSLAFLATTITVDNNYPINLKLCEYLCCCYMNKE